MKIGKCNLTEALSTLLTILYILLMYYNVFAERDFATYRLSAAVVGSLLFLFQICSNDRIKHSAWLIAIFLIILAGAAINQIDESRTVTAIIYLPGSIGISMAIANRLVLPKIFQFTYYVLMFDMLLLLIKTPETMEIHELLGSGSANGFSQIGICWTVAYYLIIRNKINIPVGPVSINLLLCLLSDSRSGIIAGVLMFTAIVAYRMQKWMNILHLWKVGLLIWILIAGSEYYLNNSANQLSFMNKFEEKGLHGDNRDLRVSMYLDSLTWRTLIYGNSRYTYYGDANTHNSFLSWHRDLGCAAFILYFLLIRSIYYGVRFNRYLLIFILVLMTRALTDEFLIPYGIWDFSMLTAMTECFRTSKTDLLKNDCHC